jgi:copper(I)-binding protein
MSMKHKSFATGAVAFAATLSSALVFAFGAGAQAAEPHAIRVENAWVRWLPNDLPAAGYATVTNSSDKPIDIVDVSSPDYGEAMLHQTVSNGSTQKMVMVDKATVPAHGTLAIEPGGFHFMLESAKHTIKVGDTVHLKFHFSDGETLDVPFAVKPPSQTK